MADFNGAIASSYQDVNRAQPTGATRPGIAQPTAARAVLTDRDYPLGVPGAGNRQRGTARFNGCISKTTGQDFWEDVYVIPSTIDLGLILSTINRTVSVYNAYRDNSQSLSSFTNNAGAGVSFTDLPALPQVIEAQDGFTATLQVTLDGPPTLNGTLDFVWAVGTRSTTLTGSRSVIFPYRPERPIKETLQFATNVIMARSGKEQRRSLRNVPRQVLEYQIRSVGSARRKLDLQVFEGQARVFGVPAWWETTSLTSSITATDTIINVGQTDFRDFRVGGLAFVIDEDDNFEALEIASFTTNTITFASAFEKSFDSGSLVVPVRSCYMQPRLTQDRFPLNLQDNVFKFRVIDNETSIASTAAFSTFNSKVLLDDNNALEGRTLRESIDRNVVMIDNGIGAPVQFTDQIASRRVSRKAFRTKTLQGLWETRQLLHSLSGRKVSFYLPTFSDDFQATSAVVSANDTIEVENVNYNGNGAQRIPKDVIRLTFADGTTLIRTIISSTEVSDDVERLQVDSAWGVDQDLADIERIEFVEKVRFDSDEVSLIHENIIGQSLISAPVRTVLE